MNTVQTKDGVQFTKIAPGGFRILWAIGETCYNLGVDLCITSACDGEHSGPNDPHHRGEAYDVRSHDFDDATKQVILEELITALGTQFYAFLESPNTPNEHFHIQVKKGVTYP